jgi:hypothetical protein
LHTLFFGMRSAGRSFRARLVLASLWLLAVSGLPARASAEEKSAPPQALERIYSFSELLGRAEVIVTGEVGEEAGGSAPVRVLEWLKEPGELTLDELIKLDKRSLDELKQAKRQRQAEERLAEEAEAKGGASGGVAKGGPARLSVCGCEPLRLPKAGTQVLLFLWERVGDAPKGALRYRLAHPQCVYELSCAAEVKAELRGGRGRDAERRAYLREWDRVMAERLARRRSDATVRALEAGRPEKGLRLVVRQARPLVLAPNGFNLSVGVENSRDAAQAIYAGPLGGFGVRLRQKDTGPETALVLRLTDPEVTRGVDSQVLALVSSDDFRAVPRNDVLVMDLHVDPKDFPALASLSGEHLVSAFYTSAQDGKGLEDLPGVPWTGAMASNEVPLTFGPLEARKKE